MFSRLADAKVRTFSEPPKLFALFFSEKAKKSAFLIYVKPRNGTGNRYTLYYIETGGRDGDVYYKQELYAPCPQKSVSGHEGLSPGGGVSGANQNYWPCKNERIQTFPDDYVITGAWGEAMRQLGNAVPVHLAYVVGDSVIKELLHN